MFYLCFNFFLNKVIVLLPSVSLLLPLHYTINKLLHLYKFVTHKSFVKMKASPFHKFSTMFALQRELEYGKNTTSI